ncbi:hypothetical protein DXG01_009142 [Tephrocybe rancida]|nr:hypothetical protein DXG01_009142 [Tephrocybe rancida]
MLSKIFITFALVLFAKGAPTAPASVPFSTQADFAIVINPVGDGDSRLYFQPESGTISEYSISGPFDTGFVYGDPSPLDIVPAAEALLGTSISAGVHVFFLSPDWALSEYYWSPATSWKGGANCPECVTTLGAQVSQNITSLSTNIDQVNNIITVTFMDADQENGTLNQAIRRNGTWSIAPLPDRQGSILPIPVPLSVFHSANATVV